MGWTWGGERHHDVRATVEPVITSEDIGGRAGRKVDGNDRGTHEVDGPDRCLRKSSDRRLYAGTEDGVDDLFGMTQAAIHLRLDIGGGAQDDRLYREAREHVCGVAF